MEVHALLPHDDSASDIKVYAMTKFSCDAMMTAYMITKFWCDAIMTAYVIMNFGVTQL